jgi:hypothetical protein
MKKRVLFLGSTGRWPVAFGHWPNAFRDKRAEYTKLVRGRLPRTTGWQPVLPGNTAHPRPVFDSSFVIRHPSFAS